MLNSHYTQTLALSLAFMLSSMANAQNLRDHVLLISIDGMHAVDYENCVNAKTCPNLAALGATGVNYTRTSTSRPSDSFPGLMALVTGGTPKYVGAFYDVAWDRVLAPTAKYDRQWPGRRNLHPGSKQRDTDRIRGRRRNQPVAAERRRPLHIGYRRRRTLHRSHQARARSVLHAFRLRFRFIPGTSFVPTRFTA